MKVKELIKALQKLPQNDEIVITSMDNDFFCEDFEIHSPYTDGQHKKLFYHIILMILKKMRSMKND